MKKYLALFVISLTLFLFHFYYAGHGIYGDGGAYYSYTHALYFQKGLNFDPVYQYLGNFHSKKHTFSRLFWDTNLGPNGIRHNPWTIGTGILWFPSMPIINFIALLFQLDINKFSVVYELGPCVSGILFIIGGLYFLGNFLRGYFDVKTTNLTIIALFFATNIFYYTSFEPALSHQPSFFLVSLLLFASTKLERKPQSFLLVGLLVGLVFITRLVDLLLLVPPLWIINKRLALKKSDAGLLLIFLLACILTIIPQLLSQYLMYGNFFKNPYFSGENGIFLFKVGDLLKILFSVHRGLFFWSPILFLGLLGLFSSLRQNNTAEIGKLFLITFLVFSFVVSCWSWASVSGFGGRYFLGSLVYLSFGLATFLSKINYSKALIIVLFFSLWNMLLVGQFYLDKERLVKDKGLTVTNFISGQFTTPIEATKLIINKGFSNTIIQDIID